MPLRKFDDKEFDSFVRSKFEGAAPVAYDPKAWKKLKAGRSNPFKWWVVLPFVILLFFAGWFVVGYFSGNPSLVSEKNLSEQTAIQGKTPPSKVSDNGSYSNPQEDLSNDSNKTEDNDEDKQSRDIKSKLTPVVSAQNTPSNVKITENSSTSERSGSDKVKESQRSGNLGIILEQVEDPGKAAGQNKKENTTINAAVPHISPASPNAGSNLVNSSASPSQIKLKALPALSEKTLVNLAGNSENKPGKDLDQEEFREIFILLDLKPKIPENFEISSEKSFLNIAKYEMLPAEVPVIEERHSVINRFRISFLVNTDFSSVDFTDFTSPGLGTGLRLSYRVSGKFHFNVGITRTQRIYNVTEREDYQLPGWILDNQGWPEGVEASCNILEIPLALRYDLIGKAQWVLYGQVSSSTFIMNREFYNFKIPGYQSGPDVIQDWEVENVNKHYFNIIGATLGLEKKLNKNFSIGVEAYWQTSVNGIGIYSVDLNSLGNQILINYSF